MAKSVVSTIREDLANARDHDPAARGDVENAVVYSGLHAIWMHRVCHVMWKRDWKGAARILAQANRFLTGIEIPPGRDDWAQVFHRSRYGDRDWGDRGDR